ncbi:MAG: hypothetical protein ACYS15_04765 [Planctomycetota bacterium]|jgi:hypothetical protein
MRSNKTTALLAFLVSATVVLLGHEAAGRKDPELRPDAIRYISRMINEYPIVCLDEGGHQAQNPHALIKTLLSDGEVLNALDVVMVEFATSRYQAVEQPALLRTAATDPGEQPFADSGQAASRSWRGPAHRMGTDQEQRRFSERREAEKRLGDQPGDRTGVQVEQEGVDHLGGAHRPKAPVGSQDDIRNSITYRIELWTEE